MPCKDYREANKYVPGYCNSIKDFVTCEGNKEACEDLIDVLATQAQREAREDALETKRGDND